MIKYPNDYLEDLAKIYPDVSKRDLQKIVNHGFRMLYLLVKRGLDVLLQNKDLWIYFGNMTKDSVSHYRYYKRKLLEKIKYLFESNKDWDEYYYLAVDEENFLKLNKKKPKKNLTLTDKVIFKNLDAAKVFYDLCKYFIKFPATVDLGYSYFSKKLKCDNATIIYTRENGLTLNDLMISSKNYNLV